jgi:phosphatidylinositol alpha-1,6-mannosyltransferase
MRVCYVASHAHGYDGWGRYTVEVVRGVRALGVEPVLVTAHPRLDPSLEGVERHVILPPLFRRRFEIPRSLLYAPRLARILRACDLVHCTVEPYAPLVALACPRRLPLVLNAHGTWAVRPLESRVQRLFFVPALRRVDRLLVLSRFTRDWMARLIALPPHEVLTGGVAPGDFERAVDVALPAWTSQEPFVLSVGMIKPRKGQHIALEAVARVRVQFPALHYVVIGPDTEAPDYVQALHRRAGDLGMDAHFHRLGSVPFDELVAWYRQAAVFMMLSTSQGSSFEGLGLVYLEAGAAGTPSIGTLGCGAEEAIVDGETGRLVPQNDPAAAAGALLALLSDEALRQRMGQAARRHAHALSWENLARRVILVYGDLLGKEAAR